MKFAKAILLKKDSNKDESEEATDKNSPVGSLQSPYIYLGLAAFLAALSVIVTIFMYQRLIILPLYSQLQTEVTEAQLKALNTVFSEKLAIVQNQVKHYAKGMTGQAYAASAEERSRQAEQVLAAIPGALRVLVSAKGSASRAKLEAGGLSFASLVLIRAVEETQKASMNAFVFQDEWYVQVVAPSIGENNQTMGTLLVIFDEKVLEPDWSVVPAGGIHLMQQVGHESKPVITRGSLSDGALTATTQFPQWSVSYSPAAEVQDRTDKVFMIVVILVGTLLAAMLVAVVFQIFLKNVIKDIRSVSTYVQSVLKDDKALPPNIKLTLLQSMVVLFTQIVKATSQKKRAKKSRRQAEAILSARQVSASKRAHAAGSKFSDDVIGLVQSEKVLEAADQAEPLFQEDSLDVEMLDDDDLFSLDDDDQLSLDDDDPGLEQDVVGSTGSEHAEPEIAEEIFSSYDIQGIYGQSLTGIAMRQIGQALGSEAIHRGAYSFCMGMDGRESSQELAQELLDGLLSTGLKVVRIGVVPAPLMYFAIEHLKLDAGVMVTGGNNPPEFNGLKMVIGGETLTQEDTGKLLARIRSQNYAVDKGELVTTDVRNDYVDLIVNDIAVAAPLTVVVDAGNGVAGELAVNIITELGCDAVPLYCDIDGSFPHHQPNPSQPENLQDLIAKVQETEADIGIAFGGDGSCLGAVTNAGNIVWPDHLLMLFAKDVVSRNPGADVIFDVECSRRLNGLISGFGGRPVMSRIGHPFIKAKMKETGALLAGEMSGHIFFKERGFGFDDGLYSAARLLEILGIEGRSSQEVFDDFPNDLSTPVLRVAVSDDLKFGVIENLLKYGNWGESTVSTIDGLRADYSDGWGLCRASNTTAELEFRFEAESEVGLKRIQEIFRGELKSLETEIDLPF